MALSPSQAGTSLGHRCTRPKGTVDVAQSAAAPSEERISEKAHEVDADMTR
ncbi:hypothetical protein BDR03DRAFT_1009932 [Suillus americanus]|nr:hypothetical protein BDR03DRAFT_1009932 [Suillus americanus]